MYKVTATVVEVQGRCHTGYRPGHKMVFESPRMVLRETDHICMFALAAIMPTVMARCSEISPSYSRIHKDGDVMPYITALRCPDPGPNFGSHGGNGSVLFELSFEEILPREKGGAEAVSAHLEQ